MSLTFHHHLGPKNSWWGTHLPVTPESRSPASEKRCAPWQHHGSTVVPKDASVFEISLSKQQTSQTSSSWIPKNLRNIFVMLKLVESTVPRIQLSFSKIFNFHIMISWFCQPENPRCFGRFPLVPHFATQTGNRTVSPWRPFERQGGGAIFAWEDKGVPSPSDPFGGS